MKIVYAASEREGAQIQLWRFLQATSSKKYNIKIAAYKSVNPGLSIDWNLDSLKDIFNPKLISFKNDNFNTYYEQIKYFNPDIIISDLEIYTSHLAAVLDKPIWQVSPNLLHHATPYKIKKSIGLSKQYHTFFNDKALTSNYTKNNIFNANRKLVYSHFGDAGAVNLTGDFEWVRPYHVQGKVSRPCHHNVSAITFANNKKFVNYLKKYEDAVLFSNFVDEKFSGLTLKNMYDKSEYECNLKNCDLFINQGHNDFMADAFYNGKYSIILPNFNEQECIANALYSEYFNLGKINYDYESTDIPAQIIEPSYKSEIKFLHQYLEEL